MGMDHDEYLGRHLSRRCFLAGAGAAGLAIPLSGFGAPEQVHDLRGQVLVNGRQATYQSEIKPGDRIVTGSDGHFVFVIGRDAFMVRSRSELQIENTPVGGLLRLVTGALGAVFNSGRPHVIKASLATAGIRGTGIYTETRGDGTYFCTCWGTVDLAATEDARDKEVITSSRHLPRLVGSNAVEGTRFRPAPFETHTDEEMDILMKCVGLRSPIVVPQAPPAQK
jgi:hypothetical protein